MPQGVLQRVLRVYPQEIKLLAWVTLIQVVMSSGSIMLNNTAQTTFLTRFGVEALPKVFLAEALATLLVSALVSFMMERFRTIRVFSGLLLFYAAAVGAIRLMIPLDVDMVYPLLYVLKSQSVGILPILYWDIVNDLFTTQQSKRLYTLISAGGVMGTTLGSLMTGSVARWIGMDNILILFMVCMAIATLLNEMTEKVAGAPLEVRTNRRSPGVGNSYRESLRQFVGYARTSPLLKYMILLLAIPNMILPLMDYQFNVIVDESFVSEPATLHFFSVFRGISNAVIFAALLFSSRLITRWGVPNSLLLHPINYMAAFGAILLQFSLAAGVYARFSTEILKTALNNPARSVLYNFFPEEIRGLIRLILRGGVVRIADFAGSGFLALFKGAVHPQAFSLVALPLVLMWVITAIRLRKTYSRILLGSLKSIQNDWSRLEAEQLAMITRHKPTRDALLKGLESADGDTVLLSAELLSRTGENDWVPRLLDAPGERSAKVLPKLLDLLSTETGRQHMDKLYLAARRDRPENLAVWLSAARRLDPAECHHYLRPYLDHPDLSVAAEALIGTFGTLDSEGRHRFRQRIDALLSGDDKQMRTAIMVIGETGDVHYLGVLLETLQNTKDPHIRAWTIQGLARMDHGETTAIIAAAAASSDAVIRAGAFKALHALKEGLRVPLLLSFLRDDDKFIRAAAAAEVLAIGEMITDQLLASLAHPSRRLRTEIMDLIEKIGLPRMTTSVFILKEIRKAYTYLAATRLLETDVGSDAVTLLREHLAERQADTIETVLRIAGVLEFGEYMHTMIHVLKSKKPKEVDKVVEILQARLHKDIRDALVPLLENRPDDEKLAAGRRLFDLNAFPRSGKAEPLRALLEEKERVLELLCLYAAGQRPAYGIGVVALRSFLGSADPLVRATVAWALSVSESQRDSGGVSALPDWVSKIHFMRADPLFAGIPIQDLMGVVES